MGTVWYIARTDTKQLYDVGKTGFWFADANGLSNDNPTPSISADRERIAEIVKYYEFGKSKKRRSRRASRCVHRTWRDRHRRARTHARRLR